jgi:hypothetical protein
MMDLPYETKWDRSGKPYWRRNNMRGTSGVAAANSQQNSCACVVMWNSSMPTLVLKLIARDWSTVDTHQQAGRSACTCVAAAAAAASLESRFDWKVGSIVWS